MAGVTLAAVLAMISQCQQHEQEVAQAEAAKSPAVREAERRERERGAKRLAIAVQAMRAIKAGAREPESLVFEEIRVSDAGDVVCIIMRGRNGFGGMTRSNYTLAGGSLTDEVKAWNKSCADRPLVDVKQEALARL